MYKPFKQTEFYIGNLIQINRVDEILTKLEIEDK